MFDLARQIGADDGAATEHDAVAARHFFNADIVFETEHVAVGGYGDGDVFADFAYPFPMCGRFVAFDFGARVYSQGACSAFGNGGGTFEREAFVFVTEPHFAGKRDVFGQALAQGFDDMVDEVGLFEQDGAAFVFVDREGGTAEIEVDFVRAEADGFQGVDCHIVGIAAQKLDGTGRAGGGLVAVGDFGGVFEPGGTGMDGVGNADELTDAFVVAADTGQQIAHHIVHQPLHRSKHDSAFFFKFSHLIVFIRFYLIFKSVYFVLFRPISARFSIFNVPYMHHFYLIWIWCKIMGTITKRTNPSGAIVYRAQIRIKKAGYPDFSESRTFSKKAMAVEWLKLREAELEMHPELLFREKRQTLCPTLREAAKRYADEVRTEYSDSKFRTLNFVMNFEIADKRIDRLRREDFTSYAFIRQRGSDELGLLPVKPSTINSDLQYLRSILKHAHFVWGYPVTWSEIDIAIEGLRRARVIGKAEKRDRLPTSEELQKLTDYFYFSWNRRSSNDMRVPMHLIMWFAIYSCRRQAEIGRLAWADLDLETRQWLVKDVKHPRGSKGNHKKFEVRDELIPLIEALQSEKIRRQMQGNPDLLLGGYQSKTISALFTNACRALHIEDLRFHDLRHEGATRLAEDGLSIPLMQQVTLHGDWESMRVYTNIRCRPRRLDFVEALENAKKCN